MTTVAASQLATILLQKSRVFSLRWPQKNHYPLAIFGASLKIAGSSQRPRPQVAATRSPTARLRGHGNHGTLRRALKIPPFLTFFRARQEKKKTFFFFFAVGQPCPEVPQAQPLQVTFSLPEGVDLRSQTTGILGKKIGRGRVGWTGQQKRKKGCANKKHFLSEEL